MQSAAPDAPSGSRAAVRTQSDGDSAASENAGRDPYGLCTPRRATHASLPALLASVFALAVFAAPAFAAAPEAPNTEAVTAITATTATFHGVLNPNALAPGEAGHYEFLYKQSASECEGASKAPEPPGTALGFEHEEVPAQEVTGLTPHTEYTVCLLARNLKGEETLGAAVSFKTALPPEAPEAKPATEVLATTATLNGVLNPNAPGDPGSYEFLYKQSETECEGQSSAPQPPGTSAGSSPEAVSVALSGLIPTTTYTFCLRAVNGAGEAVVGPPETFTTPAAAPTVSGESVSNVGSASARLSAQIDPGGSFTSYRFEYGTSVAYASSTPTATLGPGTTAVGVVGEIGELQPDTLYHYRVVASNAKGDAPGTDATFSTFPVGVLGLPDGRGYEMVTPVVNENSMVYEPELGEVGWNFQSGTGDVTEYPFQAAADGGAIAYVGTPSSGGNGSTGLHHGNEYLARRSATGAWSVANIQPAGLRTPTYQAFSSDLSVGILDSYEALSASAPGGGYNVLYAGHTADGSYAPLLTATPTHRTAETFGAFAAPSDAESLSGGGLYPLVYAGASADLSHLLFEANDALTAEAVDGGETVNNLYESVGGVLRSVNVLPDGKPEANATFGAASTENKGRPAFSHVISNDGSRIFWTDLNTQVLYVRENGTSTVQVDAAQAGAPGPGGGGRFWTATSDGASVFFTDENRLTSDSTAGPGAPDLYEYYLETGSLVDLSVDANVGEHANVRGVVGTSEDGAYVYFVAGGVLASGAPSGSCCNLYLHHEGEPTRFIAALASRDDRPGCCGDGLGDWMPGPASRTAGVTPDGHSVAFASVQSLTGYDSNGQREVFVYDAGSKSLSCASCAPSGVPPSTAQTAAVPLSWSDTYQLHWFSDDGSRVFFDSREALVPQDTNGQVDVYEWERNGTGSCGRAGGCIYLLSGGASTDGSFFLDASANGDEVFITTRAQLVPLDQNEVFDVYDVRAGVPSAVVPLACTGTGCQGLPSAPPVFATPSSVTFNGVGNFPPPTSIPVKPKVLTRAQLLARALKVCRAKRNKHKRAVCESRARKRYGNRMARKSARATRRAK